MNLILYIIAMVLVIGWVVGAFIFSIGGPIYVLLLFALIAAFAGFSSRRTEF